MNPLSLSFLHADAANAAVRAAQDAQAAANVSLAAGKSLIIYYTCQILDQHRKESVLIGRKASLYCFDFTPLSVAALAAQQAATSAQQQAPTTPPAGPTAPSVTSATAAAPAPVTQTFAVPGCESLPAAKNLHNFLPILQLD